MKRFASLSEAIREGATLSPRQCFGKLFDTEGTCAIGAAIHAILERPLRHDDATPERFLEIARANPEFNYLNTSVSSPCGCDNPTGAFNFKKRERERSTTLQNLVVHLNNDHKWTREQIADWLETEEEKLGFVTLTDERKASGRAGSTVVAERPVVSHRLN